MKVLIKIAATLIVLILLVSAIYVVYFTEPEDDDTDNTDDNGDNGDDGNDGDNNGDREFVHKVFMEEATASWCVNCPDVADILHEMYDPDDSDFYYVSMVDDESSEAQKRLSDDYNVYGFPTVFMDGGYEVVMGVKAKSEFEKKLSTVKSRNVPELYLNLTAKWDDNNNVLTTTVIVENMDGKTYKGQLKVYITEIKSRWADYNGNPYHYAFIDYAIDEDVVINNNGKETFSSEWDASKAGFSNIYPENLQIVAVLFSSTSEKKFSNPSQKINPFNAYYADATEATRVAEGSLPPSIGITTPKGGTRYILNKERRKSRFSSNTVLIGKTTIKTNVDAESGIEKVEFTFKGGFKRVTETVYEEPYEWTWDTFAIGRYTIIVKLYDKDGKTATDSIDVIAFII